MYIYSPITPEDTAHVVKHVGGALLLFLTTSTMLAFFERYLQHSLFSHGYTCCSLVGGRAAP